MIPLEEPVREKAIQLFASHPIEEYRTGMLEFGSSVPDLVPAFRRLDVPVLGLCGANDPYPDKPEVLAGMKNFRESAVHSGRRPLRALGAAAGLQRGGPGLPADADVSSAADQHGGYVVAVDVGGTCTDCVVFRHGDPIRFGKALSTPPRFARGVLDSVRATATEMGIALERLLGQTRLFLHGSTVVDNAIFTREGARTGLITTAGFEDTLLVTRGAYGRWSGQPEEVIKHPVASNRPAPLVPHARIAGRARAYRLQGRGAGGARGSRCRAGS